MKLFENHPSEVLSYLKQPIIENDYELEIIFGSTPYKNPIDKKIFMNIPFSTSTLTFLISSSSLVIILYLN